MRVRVASSVDLQIAVEARFWRSKAGKEIAERLVRELRNVINTFVTGLPGSRVEGLAANFKRVRASKHPPFYLYYYVDEEAEEVFVFLLRCEPTAARSSRDKAASRTGQR